MRILRSTCWLLVVPLSLVRGIEDFVVSEKSEKLSWETSSSKTPSARRKSDGTRQLSEEDNYVSYLVDRNGNAYEPYSLAWRYLGMYIDCDVDAQGDNEERFLEGDDDDDCQRTVLWAAYVDPRYKGGTIGEYQFYDIATDSWDTSTCQTRRCSRMDCHEPNSHFKLVGVFKETNGFYDWGEQLFKHEGYCVWNDEDTYEFMTGRLESWPSQCTQLRLPDSNGDTLYLHMLPLGEGNLTMGVFADSSCTQVSSTTTFYDYVVMYYSSYYYGSDYGTAQAEVWEEYIEQWNEAMSTWKICQPCRAYSTSQNYDNDNHDDHRFLENNENDGEGDEEQWGYNCYDDAGYTNVNQCYKFEVKTDLEPAEASDLARASEQGSILRIKFKGKVYGSGGYGSAVDYSTPWMVTALVLGLGMLVGGSIALIIIRQRRFKRELPPSFRENFHIESKETIDSLGQYESGEEVRGNRLIFTVLYKLFAQKVCSSPNGTSACSPMASCPPPTLCGNIEYADNQEGNVDDSDASEDIRQID